MEKHLFNLKIAAKEMERNSKRAQKQEKIEKDKTKKAIQKGNTEVARIHAENAIRQKTQSVNYLKMAARIDAVASRIQSVLTTRNVSKSMAGVVASMESALRTMNLEQISAVMDRFEAQNEDLDVQSSYMDETMSKTVTTDIPQTQVEDLMKQVADEAGLDLIMDLPHAPTASSVSSTTASTTGEQDDLSARLARLRQTER